MSAPAQVTTEQLKQFQQLNLISNQHLQTLLDGAEVAQYQKDDIVFQKPRNFGQHYFLLAGEVDVDSSGYDRRSVIAGDMHSYAPLDHKLPAASTATAVTACTVLHVNRERMEQLLSWSQNAEYNVVEFVPTLDGGAAEDEQDGNWMDRLLEMPLTKHLAAADIQRLFSQLEDQQVEAGETIVKARERGEYFYILQQGRAQVTTPRQECFSLTPGNYFGEEALVANAVRSATVTMTTGGVVGRLHKDAFDQILKRSLVRYADPQELKQLEQPAVNDVTILDVRLPAEFRLGHHQNATNIPIHKLRERLSHLDQAQKYLIADAGVQRSELAAYILRQAGFNSFVLQSACA